MYIFEVIEHFKELKHKITTTLPYYIHATVIAIKYYVYST